MIRHPVFTYSTPGTYDVRLTVTGATGSDSLVREALITASAPPPAPVAAFSGSPTSGLAPLSVAFTDESANGPTGWAWDFQADGTIDLTERHPTFVYTVPGTYVRSA